MDKIIDHLFILEGEGHIKDYNGTYTSYKYAKIDGQHSTPKSNHEEKKTQKTKTPKIEEKRKLSYFEKKEYNDIPNEIEKLETEKKDIEGKFLSGDLASDVISTLSQRLGEITKLVDEKETRWLELAEFM